MAFDNNHRSFDIFLTLFDTFTTPVDDYRSFFETDRPTYISAEATSDPTYISAKATSDVIRVRLVRDEESKRMDFWLSKPPLRCMDS